MHHLLKRHTISFGHAFSGIAYAVSTQPNFVIHLILSTCAICLAIILNITRIEWLILSATIFGGLVIEMINTSIESCVDLLAQDWKKEAKFAKDTSAAAMLIYSIGAIITAALLFLPKLIT
jgi:diacylglycerol kinase